MYPFLILEKTSRTTIEYCLILDENNKIFLGTDIKQIYKEIYEIISNKIDIDYINNIFKNSIEYNLLKTIYALSDEEIKKIEILYNKNKITITTNGVFLFESIINFETFLILKLYNISKISDLKKIF